MSQAPIFVKIKNPYGDDVETVELSRNADVLEHMAARNQIDLAQKQAGDRILAAFNVTTGSLGMGMDYTQDRVDTSGVSQDMPAALMQARDDIRAAVKALGMIDYAVVRMICGEGLTVSQCAERFGFTDKTKRKYYGSRFRDALDILAHEWGYSRSKPTLPLDEGNPQA